jgi:hypothetical protein
MTQLDKSTQRAKRERIRTALKLAEVRWRDFDRRRSYEWKVNFGLWPALGALAGFFWKTNQKLEWYEAATFISLLIVVAVFYWFRWSVGMWRRNRGDQEAAYHFWRIADGVEGEDKPWTDIPPPSYDWRGTWKDGLKVSMHWSHGSQIIITLVLVVITILGVIRSALQANPTLP